MRKTLSGIDTGLAFIENSLIILTLGIMVLLSFLQVILRNFFETGILWGDIFLRHLVLWVGFIGASLATRQEKHINIDILNRIVPKKSLPPIKIIIDIFSVLICFILAKASYEFVMMEKDAGSIIFENIPAWFIQIIIPAGFTLIGLRFALKIIEHSINWISPQSTDKKEK
ncbi:MAG: TRAP transporter small permease [Calditrichaeota bacterium]|nr:TRAP transporter small permease [Calditrichota bacterium]RQW06229.1 MAG: TRAP transporter small permease [Calditrichota bacterium]